MAEKIPNNASIVSAQKGSVEDFIPFVEAIARRFTGRGSELCDLIQAGSLGLIRASESFNSGKGTRFEAYAFKFIEGAIRRFIRNDHTVVLPDKLIRGNSERAGGRGSEIGCSTPDVFRFISLLSLDDSSVPEIGVYEDTEDQISLRCTVKKCVRSLPLDERSVVTLRYYHQLTQKQTARLLGISQSAVSKVESKAFKMIKASLDEQNE